MPLNYQPANWTSEFTLKPNPAITEHFNGGQPDFQTDFQPDFQPNPQPNFQNPQPNFQNLQPNQTFTDRQGRRCRVVCENPRPHDQRLDRISRLIIGRNINDARRIYPNIRVVKRNGQDVPTTMDYRPDRINVETRNNIVVRVNGFY